MIKVIRLMCMSVNVFKNHPGYITFRNKVVKCFFKLVLAKTCYFRAGWILQSPRDFL